MARKIIPGPAGDEFYPVRIEKVYFKRGDLIVVDAPLYDLATANGQQMCIRASESGKTVSEPHPAGTILPSRKPLAEIDVRWGGDVSEAGADEDPEAVTATASLRRVDLHTPVDAELYPATILKVHAEPGGRIERGSRLYTIETASGAEIPLEMPLSGRILSSNDKRNLTRQRAIAVLEPDEDDPLAAALGTASGVYLLAGGTFASNGGEADASDEEEVVAAPQTSSKRWGYGFIAGLCIIALVLASGWYVLTYVPYDLDGSHAETYYGKRVNDDLLGGKRRLFTSDETAEGI
nr:hypothetical protein [Marinicella sp. W31]MDC2879815.1 hypothetical protein [Marinicella sp. W31]